MTYKMVVGAGVSSLQVSMPHMQLAEPRAVTVTNNISLELPAGAYNVSLDGTNVVLPIQVAEGDENPTLVASVLAQAQPVPGQTPTPAPTASVSGLPSTGAGVGGSSIVWPAAAAAMVLMLLAGQFVVGTVRNRK